MSIDSRVDDFPIEDLAPADAIQTFDAPGLPPGHLAEADAFARHIGVPGHRQEATVGADIVQVGGGGLGSWIAVGLLRSGTGRVLTVIDPDRFERINAGRQLMFGADLGAWKAHALGRNLVGHAVGGARITAIALPFQEAVAQLALPASLAVFGVDNNACRLAGARWARERRIPAVFTMLSMDGMRCHCFLQGPNPWDACVHCALPNFDAESAMPCAAAIISSCFLAAAYTIFFCHRALMGWPEGVMPFTWREADLLAATPERVGFVRQRPDCPTCGPLR
jgi:molybdopterin/thiamine biosynthesis adenylyltransferase